MIAHIAYVLIILAVGFSLGRIKNAAKLAAIKNYVTTVEAATVTDVKSVVATVKSKL